MLTRAIVNVVFEGNLSADMNLVQVLQAMLSSPPTDTAVLRIACPSENVSGRLAVAKGRYIVGAQVDDADESGYAAMRKLLALKDGNFAFLDAQGRFPFDVDPTLHIPIDRILALMPELPESPADLFDEKALLDDLFTAMSHPGSTITGSAEVFPQTAQAGDSGSLPDAQSASESAWAAIQPLLLEDSGVQQQGPLLSGLAAHSVRVDERRITFGKLKAAAIQGLSWRRPGILLAVVLLLVLCAMTIWPHITRWFDQSFASRTEAPSRPATQ